MTEFSVESGGVALAGEDEAPFGDAPAEGPQPAVLLLHGLTATRRYVVHGSHHLPRHGARLLSYDARGHGRSDAAPQGAYDYVRLADDAAEIIASRLGEGRPVLAGHSMGAHTAAALALRDPSRYGALVLICPAVMGEPPGEDSLAYWDRLAGGLESGGVEGFVGAYDEGLDPDWRETLLRITRQRLGSHSHPEGVARALREIPRSIPFDGLGALGALDLPALVIASHDDSDPGHPYEIGAAWAETLPRAELVSEDEGESPLAWRGGLLSREIERFCETDAVRERL